MTSVDGRGPIASLATQSEQPGPAVGQKIEAIVLGRTRQGVSVRIGQEQFQLHIPSRLANAGTLLLEGVPPSATAGQRVRIVASDDLPLAKPTLASLNKRSEPAPSTASAVVEQGLIKVSAQPLASDGKALGPNVTLQLKTSSHNLAGKGAADQPSAAGGAVQRSTAGVQIEASRAAYQQTGSTIHQQPLPETSDVQIETGRVPVRTERVSERALLNPVPAESIPNDGRSPNRSGPIPASISAPGTPNATPAVSTKGTVGEPRLPGTPIDGRWIAVSSIPSEGCERPTAGPMAVSAYRTEAEIRTAGSQKTPLGISHSVEPRSAVDHGRTVMATVVERTEAGKIVLNAEGQRYRVEQPIDLPTGASVQVIPAFSMSAWPPPRDRGGFGDPGTHLARLIEILDDIDRAGRQAASTDQPARAGQLPMPDARLASKFLGLLNAAHGMPSPAGRAPTLSKPADLTTAQKDLIQTLVRELGSMASEALADGWKSLTLPLGTDQTQAVSLYFREHALDPDDHSTDGEAEPSETQRAVFDISFSQLGRCQIDALCLEQRFELLIRSDHPFSEACRQDIAGLFSSACEIAGMRGDIGFRIGGFFEPVRSSVIGSDLRT